ncbi:MAG TPA: SEC-C domain-containing protein, partial [bacterium]|nr:SEC-C domain-containing protein [bacterium]
MVNITFKNFLRIAVILFISAAVSGFILSLTGIEITEGMLPMANRIITGLHSNYTIHEIRIDRNTHPERVIFTAIKDTPGGGMVFVNSVRGLPFTGYFTVNSGYMLPMIAFAFLFAWPYLPFYKKITAIPIMVPLILVIWLFDIVICVIGGIESGSRSIINVGTLTFQERIEGFLYSFIITGGRQFLGIVVFLTSITPLHLFRAKPRKNIVHPNDPCPCGSGRKYKKCCG